MFNLNSFGNTRETPEPKWVASSAATWNRSISGPSAQLPQCQHKMGFKLPTFPIAVLPPEKPRQPKLLSHTQQSMSREGKAAIPQPTQPLWRFPGGGTKLQAESLRWGSKKKEAKQAHESSSISHFQPRCGSGILSCRRQSSSGAFESASPKQRRLPPGLFARGRSQK